MNNLDKTFSLAGFGEADISAYTLIGGNTEQCFSFAAGQIALDRCFTSHCTMLCGHSFMLIVDVSMNTLYRWNMTAMQRFKDTVFTVVGVVRQPGAFSQRQTKRVVTKQSMFVQPVIRRMVNLRL